MAIGHRKAIDKVLLYNHGNTKNNDISDDGVFHVFKHGDSFYLEANVKTFKIDDNV
jgi:hypothetical protein